MTDYSNLTDRELDARAGILAGTVNISAATSHADKSQPYVIKCICLRRDMGGLVPDRPYVEHDYLVPDEIPHYSSDLNAARELEEEIERRGLASGYVTALRDLTGGITPGLAWRCVTATARQRAEAFCAAMDGV